MYRSHNKSRFITLLISSCVALVAAQADRITRPIEATRTAKLTQVTPPEVTPSNDLGLVDRAAIIDGITLSISPSADQQKALEAFLEAQRDPSSTDFQRYLSPEEFADRFGASHNDINAIVSWLRGVGLNVDQIARGRSFVTVSGGVALVEAAFHTSLHYYDVSGTRHFAPMMEPSVPEALSGIVTHIRGLDDFRPRPSHVRMQKLSADYNSGGSHYLAPADFASIYNIAPLLSAGINGSGQTVAVLGQTDFSSADIAAFRSTFGLSANIPQVVLTGTDPGTRAGDQTEAELDLEWIGAIAQNATILYINSTNVFTSAQYAIDQKLAPVISMSYSSCEPQTSSTLRTIAQQAAAEGITWVASSGDSGAAGCDSATATATHGLAVNIPASFPEVTAVGGTTLSEGSGSYWSATQASNGGSATSYIPEVAWNDTASRNELSASGGGASIYYAKPSWQSGTGVPADGMRDVPDLAFAASPDHDGYLIYVNGSLQIVGGTSAPTPAFAGVLGLLNQYLLRNSKISQAGLGNINPSLYHLAQVSPSVFHDSTAGNNVVPCKVGTTNCATGSLGYTTTAGYDQVTGLGSADIGSMFANWSVIVASTGTTTSLTANPSTISTGANTTLTATVKPSSGTTAPTGSVSLTTGSKTLGSATLTTSGSVGTATLSVAASSLVSGTNTIVATYTGSTTFGGSTGSATVTVGGTSGSNVVPSVTPNPVTRSGNSWSFTVTLTETAGVATTLTGFTLNGANYSSSIRSFFGTNQIGARGSIAAPLRLTGLTPPTNVVFGFIGTDASGRNWTQSITVPFN